MINEIQATQNPAWGASLISQFVSGYHKECGKGPSIALAFIVLPMLLHDDISKTILSTYSGLIKFEEKFKDSYDLLASINDRAIALRELTRKSIAIGVSGRLFALDPESGILWPGSVPIPKMTPAGELKLLGGAERLGHWLGEASPQSVVRILRLEF